MRHETTLALLVGIVCGGGGCGLEKPPVADHVGQQSYRIRPTDGDGWNGNGYGAGVSVEHFDTPSSRFRLHFVRTGQHAVSPTDDNHDSVPDFVEQFGLAFDQTIETYVDKLGFALPLSDESYHDRPDYGGDGRFDVYLQDQNGGADGYLVTEACSGTPQRCAGYMVVENDFAGYGYPSQQEAMQILASHEFFHAIQNAYVHGIEQAFLEGSAVWGTERVFPATGDLERFLPHFVTATDRPINDTPKSPADIFPYATAIWPRYLSERFGDRVMTAIFEQLGTGTSADSLAAIDAVLRRDHQSSLAAAFAEFTLWNALTGSRTAGNMGYKEAARYPEVEPVVEARPHPYRLIGEINYLAALYYRLVLEPGLELTVSVENEQAQLALHLVTGTANAPVITSSEPGQKELAIVTKGDVLLVVASTVTSGRALPVSLAVRAKPPAVAPTPQADGGCSAAGAARGRSVGIVFALLLIGVLIAARQASRRGRACGLMLALMVLMSSGCSGEPRPLQEAGSDVIASDIQRDRGVPLSLGEFLDISAGSSGLLEISTPVSGDETFLLVLMSHDTQAKTQWSYGLRRRTAANSTLRAPTGSRASAKPDSLHPRRRNVFGEDLARILKHNTLPLPYQQTWLLAAKPPPEVGDTQSFTISNGVVPTTVQAEALYVDSVAAFWIDRTTEPKASIEPGVLAELANGFAKIIVPRERQFFGQESDVDQNGIINVLLSPLVSANEAFAYVSPCDLVDPNSVAGCAVSNQMELVYLTPPSEVPAPYNTSSALLETIAHEFQHAIYFYHKYLLNQSTDKNENPYITEGLSHLAQDLSGYQAGNFYVVKTALDQIDLVSLPNVASNDVSSYVSGSADGVLRGGSYLLLRYLFDQAGGVTLDAEGNISDNGGIAFLRRFIDQPQTGLPSVLAAAGTSYSDLVRAFWTTMALSNRKANGQPISNDPRFQYLPTTSDPITGRQRGCDLFAPFHGMTLPGPKMQALDAADGKVFAGGADLLTFNPDANQTQLTLTFESPTDDGKLEARLIRIH